MSIAPVSETTIAPDGAGLGRMALTLPIGLEYDRWQAVGETLRTIRDTSLLFWWGDWLNYGEERYGEKYAQAVEASDYACGTLANAAYVCNRIRPSRRRVGLSFSHHQDVAALEPAEQDMWLDDAEANGWSSKTLREMIRQTKAEAPATMSERAEPVAVEEHTASEAYQDALCELHRALGLDLDFLYRALRFYEQHHELPELIAGIMGRIYDPL